MARKTILVSDLTGNEIEEKNAATVTIRYTPDHRCIETKSLKLYLMTFQGTGIFAEHLAPRIARHLAAAVAVPVAVTLQQQVRGGIVTKVQATGGAARHDA